MASNEAATVTRTGGYDLPWVEEPPDDLKCLICFTVAKDPYQHGDSDCGKVFCATCITEYQKYKESCPNCRRKLTIFKDTRSARHIRTFKTRCKNHAFGCEWVGDVDTLDAHLESCEHATVPCSNKCKKRGVVVTLRESDLQSHLKDHCPRRQYECPHCKEKGEYATMTTTHLDICPKVLVYCPNADCAVTTPRCEMDAHRMECKFEPLNCKYALCGCEHKPARKDIETHEQNYQLHLGIITNKVLQLSLELERQKNQHLKATSTSPCVFKVDFEKIKAGGALYRCPSFYTSHTGYKLCIALATCISPTYLSLFALLLKGDNDDSLPFPFTGTVMIDLLNQLEDKHPFQRTITFPAESKSSGRALNDDDKSPGYGIPEYLPEVALGYKVDENCQYLKDGTLFFKVSVRMPASYPRRPWLQCTISKPTRHEPASMPPILEDKYTTIHAARP